MSAARFTAYTPLYDSHREVVKFAAYVGGATVACAISREALMDHFENTSKEPASVFSRHRAAIECIAEKLIAKGRYESDGSILIRSSDC